MFILFITIPWITVIISDSVTLITVTIRASTSSLSLIVTEYRSEVVHVVAIDGANSSFHKGGQESAYSNHLSLLSFMPMYFFSLLDMSSCTHIISQRKHCYRSPWETFLDDHTRHDMILISNLGSLSQRWAPVLKTANSLVMQRPIPWSGLQR